MPRLPSFFAWPAAGGALGVGGGRWMISSPGNHRHSWAASPPPSWLRQRAQSPRQPRARPPPLPSQERRGPACARRPNADLAPMLVPGPDPARNRGMSWGWSSSAKRGAGNFKRDGCGTSVCVVAVSILLAQQRKKPATLNRALRIVSKRRQCGADVSWAAGWGAFGAGGGSGRVAAARMAEAASPRSADDFPERKSSNAPRRHRTRPTPRRPETKRRTQRRETDVARLCQSSYFLSW